MEEGGEREKHGRRLGRDSEHERGTTPMALKMKEVVIQEMQMASRCHGQSLGLTGRIQLIASQNQGPRSYHGKIVNSSNRLNQLGSSFSPVKLPDENTAWCTS